MRTKAAVALLLGVLLASEPVSGADGPGSAIDPDVEAIRALIEEARKADLAGDRSFYQRVLAKNFSLGTSTGEWETRESKLAYLGSERHKVSSEAVSDLKIRVYPMTAIATFTVAIDGAWEGKSFHARAIVTETFVKDAGRWMLAATHASAVRP